jgi:hypothetical protein
MGHGNELPTLRTRSGDAAAGGAAGLAAGGPPGAFHSRGSRRPHSDEGKAAYRRRKWIAEPPNGWIKNVLGFRQFSMRGMHRVCAEWKLVCMALNLRRMATMKAV